MLLYILCSLTGYVMRGGAVSYHDKCVLQLSVSVLLVLGTGSWELGTRILVHVQLMAFLVVDDDRFHFPLLLYSIESHGIYFHSNTFIIWNLKSSTFYHHLFGSLET